MNAYETLLAKGLEELGRHLRAGGAPDASVTEITDLLGRVNFPGLLAVLGNSGKAGDGLGTELLRPVAEGLASTPNMKAHGLDADEVERVLTAILVHRAPPQAASRDPALGPLILEAALNELGRRGGVPVTPEQASKIVKLLSTGQFFSDVTATTAAVLHTLPGIPIALLQDVRLLDLRLLRLTKAIAADLAGTPFALGVILEDLKDGKLDSPPAVLPHTMAALFSFATVRTTGQMIATLLRPENESVRLAILIYARANGIPLDPADLDALRDKVFNAGNPDLGPVLVSAFDRLTKLQGQDAVLKLLRRMAG